VDLSIQAIANMPKKGECRFKGASSVPITLVIDQVRDPGNMGSLIRTAAAVGCERILLSKGCVDLWDPKVIRSGMGLQIFDYSNHNHFLPKADFLRV
jgi:tRNA G18 (ribose-2'-O)-methylase SpoU